jgi:hypothetical protein
MWLAILAGLAAIAPVAGADPAAAKALFDDGRRLIEAADKLADATAKATKVDAACDKFAASLEQDPLLGTRLNLAACRVRQHRFVEAYGLLQTAVAEATRTHDREAFAKQQLAAVTASVVRIDMHIAAPDLVGLEVELGGHALPRAAWSQVQIADPGPIVVDARAPGHVPVHVTRDGAAGAEVTIEVPALDVVVAAPPPPTIAHARSKIPYLVIGAGAALLATSGGLGLHARSRYNTAKAAGDPARVTSAQHEADVATGFLAAGAVAVGVGIWLYVRDRPADTPAITAAATRDSLAIGLAGTF